MILKALIVVLLIVVGFMFYQWRVTCKSFMQVLDCLKTFGEDCENICDAVNSHTHEIETIKNKLGL